MKRSFFIFSILIFFTGGIWSMSACLAAEENREFNSLRLPFGSAEKRLDLVKVSLNSIISTDENRELSSDELFQKLGKADVILVGESHTCDQHHQVQKRIIEGLADHGFSVVLGLEMFTPPQSQTLSDFLQKKFDEESFMDKTGWFKSWGHNFRYYQPIFSLARERNIPMLGVNIPAELVSKARRSGVAGFTEDERKLVAEPDITDTEHRFFVNTLMQGIGAEAPGTFTGIYLAQCLWDAAMGEGAIKAAQSHPGAKIVILAGTGHVAYALGIARIICKRSALKTAIVLPIDISLPEKTDKKPFSVHLGPDSEKGEVPHTIVSRGIGDFLIGVPEEEYEKYPTLGMSLKENPKGLEVSIVFPDSVGEKQGFKNGDVLQEINNHAYSSVIELKKWLTYVNWGDRVDFLIRRGGKPRHITFTFTPGKNQK